MAVDRPRAYDRQRGDIYHREEHVHEAARGNKHPRRVLLVEHRRPAPHVKGHGRQEYRGNESADEKICERPSPEIDQPPCRIERREREQREWDGGEKELRQNDLLRRDRQGPGCKKGPSLPPQRSEREPGGDRRHHEKQGDEIEKSHRHPEGRRLERNIPHVEKVDDDEGPEDEKLAPFGGAPEESLRVPEKNRPCFFSERELPEGRHQERTLPAR